MKNGIRNYVMLKSNKIEQDQLLCNKGRHNFGIYIENTNIDVSGQLQTERSKLLMPNFHYVKITCMSPVLRCFLNFRPSTSFRRLDPRFDDPGDSVDPPPRRVRVSESRGPSADPVSTKPPRPSSIFRSRSLTAASSSCSLRNDVRESRADDFCRQ